MNTLLFKDANFDLVLYVYSLLGDFKTSEEEIYSCIKIIKPDINEALVLKAIYLLNPVIINNIDGISIKSLNSEIKKWRYQFLDAVYKKYSRNTPELLFSNGTYKAIAQQAYLSKAPTYSALFISSPLLISALYDYSPFLLDALLLNILDSDQSEMFKRVFITTWKDSFQDAGRAQFSRVLLEYNEQHLAYFYSRLCQNNPNIKEEEFKSACVYEAVASTNLGEYSNAKLKICDNLKLFNKGQFGEYNKYTIDSMLDLINVLLALREADSARVELFKLWNILATQPPAMSSSLADKCDYDVDSPLYMQQAADFYVEFLEYNLELLNLLPQNDVKLLLCISRCIHCIESLKGKGMLSQLRNVNVLLSIKQLLPESDLPW
ncbi:hypothetical protein [Psychrosphaera algicola]|uniref:Uncharacterized protein n=1 Tax=Psychrosphaera algicola TaxID=3023714 RepID=A0ABT5FGP8_9GAMM|nr:hypothetical protein [Psychrosphaera sp. G1-22]MDC2890454.1 hypothetical protein [Psychrosphaera sp. G1-22]